MWANGFHRTKQLQLAELAANDDAPDVLFAGTSKVWYGIDAELFTEVDGRSSYNAGLPAAGPQRSTAWLLDVVEPTVEPELVVWGLSAYDVSGRLDSTSQRIVDAVELQQQLFAPLAWSELMTGAEAVDEGLPETWIVAPEDVGVDQPGTADHRGARVQPDAGRPRDVLRRRGNRGRLRRAGHDRGDGRDAPGAAASRWCWSPCRSPTRFGSSSPTGHRMRSPQRSTTSPTEIRVDHLDLSRSMPDEAFADYTHLTGTGAADFTRLLLDELDRLDED